MSRPIRVKARWLAPAVAALAAAGGATAVGLAAHTTTQVMRVGVTEREYSITLTTKSFKPGKTTFVVHNRGKVAHEFEVRGPGVAGKRIPGKIAPGATRSLTVRLQAGKYLLFCPIHIALGMKKAIHVGTTSTSAGTSTSGTTTSSGGSWG
jgi:uncharacterized cupredoxin-like copper-binding protein